ncbi:MAG: T9SS type A sorting domain-containing protein [Calditrichaeota bacterium]|nr:T9SS type A sorting domain-containing protein [Calditrichota bacterium]
MRASRFIIVALLCTSMLKVDAFTQEGIFFRWVPVANTNNYSNPLNWDSDPDTGNVPDSLDTVQLWPRNTSGPSGVYLGYSYPNRVVRFLITTSGQNAILYTGDIWQTYTITDSLHMWGDGFGGNLIVHLPDSSFTKITGSASKTFRDSARLETRGVSRWEGGQITCPDRSGAGWVNYGALEISTEYFGALNNSASFRNEASGIVTKTFPEPVTFTNGFDNKFENFGHIYIQNGKFDIRATSGVLSGTVDIADSGSLYIKTASVSISNLTVTGNGTVYLQSTINSNRIYVYNTNRFSKLYLNSTFIDGPGTIIVSDSVTVAPVGKTIASNQTFIVDESAVFLVDGELNTSLDTLYLLGKTVFTANGQLGGSSDAFIINRGEMELSPSLYPFSFSNVINDSTGVMQISVPLSETLIFTPRDFLNYGIINQETGTIDFRLNVNCYGIWNMGEKTHLNTKRVITWYHNAELNSAGTIKQTANNLFRIFGKIKPAGEATGTLTLIPYTAVDFYPSTRLQMDLNGPTPATEYDQLVVEGTIHFNGTLEVQVSSTFQPALNDTFEIIKYHNSTGAFADTLLPSFPDTGLHLELVQTDSAMLLIVAGIPTGISHQPGSAIPDHFFLQQNYPNPFNPQTTIRYGIPTRSLVKIEVFNVLGKRVATLINARQAAGEYTINWNASLLPSGIYLYRLQAGTFVQSHKMMLIR